MGDGAGVRGAGRRRRGRGAGPGGDRDAAADDERRRRGCKQFHLPDVSTWSSQLPANVHVVVLDIAAMADMVPRTASELRMLQQHLRDEDRHLVLANLVTTQLETMEDAGVLLDFDADDLCGEASTAMQRAQWLLAHREAWGRPQG
jgi:hypothetical protein